LPATWFAVPLTLSDVLLIWFSLGNEPTQRSGREPVAGRAAI